MKTPSKCLSIFLLFLISLHLTQKVGAMTKTGERKISLEPPVLSAEESRSRFIPKNYKCDACRAIAFQVRLRTNETPNITHSCVSSEALRNIMNGCLSVI